MHPALLVSLTLVATSTQAAPPAKRARAAVTQRVPAGSVEAPAVPVAPEPPPENAADVKMVARLADAIARAPSAPAEAREALLPHFVDALMASCEEVLRDSGLTDLRVARLDELRAEAWKRLAASLKGMPDGRRRREALERLARRLTTRAQAVSLLDWWFGLDAPSRAARGDEEAAAERQAAAQLRSGASDEAELQFSVADSRVLDEVGALHGPDGVIDTGEWVHLGLGIRNASSRPWFSTTARVAGYGGCLWTDPNRAHELAELGPGDVAELPVWVFISFGVSGRRTTGASGDGL